MKSILTIARRDFAEKRFVMLAGVIFALFPPVLSVMPFMHFRDRAEFIATAGSFGALAVTVIVAIMLGASMIGRDLSEGRMSFFFARPVSGAVIWLGKLAAALALMTGTLVIMAVPVLFVHDAWLRASTYDLHTILGVALVTGVLMVLIAHALSTMIRSRSPLALLDIVLLGLFAVGVLAVVRPLRAAFADELSVTVGIVLVALLLASLVASGAWQLSRGRIDLRRNHLELSRFLWPSLGVALLIVGSYVAWVVSATPHDLTRGLYVQGAGSGPWIFIAGASPGRADYRPAFFYNTTDESYIPVGLSGSNLVGSNSAMIRNGVAVWSRPNRETNGREILMRRLVPRAATTSLGVSVAFGGGLALSDDGKRLAVASDQMLTIHDLDEKRILAAVRLPRTPHESSRVRFRSPNTVAVSAWTLGGRERVSFELDIDARNLRSISESVTSLRPLRRQLGRITAAEQLADGRLALINIGHGEQGTLLVLDRQGAVEHRVPLGRMKYGMFVAELADGNVVVAGGSNRRWNAHLVDLQEGRVTRTEQNFKPVESYISASIEDRFTPIAGATVGFDDRGSLIRWDPRSGERRTLIRVTQDVFGAAL